MPSRLHTDPSPDRLHDEETPLLVDQPPKTNDDGLFDESNGESGGERTVIVDEPSNKRLAIVLGSIWVGVFLGALGKSKLLQFSHTWI